MKQADDISVDSLKSLEIYLKTLNNAENAVYVSKVPEIAKTEPCMLGIDEAGRGPVLGPMVYGIAYCPLSKSEKLKQLQCEDSKALNEAKRDVIFSEICEAFDTVGWASEIISPNFICNNMFSRSIVSLNDISMNSAIGLIRQAIAAGVNIAEIYVDTVGPPEKYQAYLSKLFPEYAITVAKKADSTYPIVSAASICAKVIRDYVIKTWKFQEESESSDKQVGSGYPADPVTKKFLMDEIDPVFGFPQLVRFSWSTAQNILNEHAYTVDWPVEETEQKTDTPITSYFKPYAAVNAKMTWKKHKFFKDRCLKNIYELM